MPISKTVLDGRRYRDRKDYMRKYQRKWISERRKAFFAGKECICGEPATTIVSKGHSVRTINSHVWSYGDKKRIKSLARFDTYCGRCAKRILSERQRLLHLGKPSEPDMLSHSTVWAIRGRLLSKESLRSIARAYGISHHVVLGIKNGRCWGWMKRGSRQVYGIDSLEVCSRSTQSGAGKHT